MFMSILLLASSLATADTGDAFEDCEKWGKIVAQDGTTGQVGADSLWFDVGGQDCPGVQPENCEWYLLPDDGSRGQLPADNMGGSMQWLPPGAVDSCPPMKATLIVECVDLDSDILKNSVNLRIDDSSNRCDLMGGGCIAPTTQAGGLFLMMPFLWSIGRRKQD
jgi:hypothetical protein